MKATKFPDSQPFNVAAKRNKAKKNSWWQHAPFHNNGGRNASRQTNSVKE